MTKRYTKRNQLPQLDVNDLDRIRKVMTKESMPNKYKDDKCQEQWEKELARRIEAVVDMFELEEETITQAKVADGITRMFEKIAYNDLQYGTQLRKERADAIRADVGIEITKNVIDDLDTQLEKKRISYYSSMAAYRVARWVVRPGVIGRNNLNWGDYKPAHEMARVRRIERRNRHLTADTLVASTARDFHEYARDTGLIEMPDAAQQA